MHKNRQKLASPSDPTAVLSFCQPDKTVSYYES